jgi:hypothetical protein
MIEIGDSNSELYFLKSEGFSSGFYQFKCLICIEMGKQLYLEKQFYSIYKYHNLKDPKKFEEFVQNQTKTIIINAKNI